MDGWMDGGMDGWMDGWRDGWMDRWTERGRDGWMDMWICGSGRQAGRQGMQADGQMATHEGSTVFDLESEVSKYI